MKSIGSSSKMLRESIGERISEKTSSAKHKFVKEYKNTKNVMGSWTSDTKSVTTKKIKTVKSKIENLSLKRNKHKRSFSVEDDERPQTIAGNEELFQSLTFNSPLNNRSYNLENLPKDVSNYEIPKSLNRNSSGDLPSYDQVVKDNEFLKRNSSLTQSLYSKVQKQNNLDRGKNRSDSQLNNISSETSSDENESMPPNIPAPEFIYGRIRKLPSSDYENAPMIPLRKAPPPPPVSSSKVTNVSDSDKATICGSSSERSLTDIVTSRKSLNISEVADRSDSWQYCDSISRDTIDSESSEPIYANNENERHAGTSDVIYGQMAEAKSNLLSPLKPQSVETSERKSQTLAREILKEFDPLSRESFDAFIMTKMNHLSLLETLLSEETYGTIEEIYTEPNDDSTEENSSTDSVNAPMPPERDDSLAVATIKASEPVPKAPKRTKKPEPRVASVIIHQNLKLKGSIENLAEPFFAKVDDEPSTSGVVDLSKPKPSASSWFVDNSTEKFKKNNLDNPNNFSHATAEKVSKTIPQLPKVSNVTANREQYLPTYEESKNDEIVNTGAIEKTPDAPTKSRSSIFHFGLKRKTSFKESKLEVKDFIPRAVFSEDSAHQHDKSVILFKLPSGVIEDMLKELSPRFVELKRRQFKAYSDSEFKILKEHLDLSYLSSIQFLVNHKFSEFKTDLGGHIYCFELNLAIPKNLTSSTPNALLDNKGSPVKTQRVSYVYGIHSKNEK